MENNDKILIVEDNVIWGESYKKWIGAQYQTKLAFNKTEALEFCNLYDPDLIILDLGLPQIQDGFDLLDELIKRGKDYQIIVVTSFRDHKYALEAQKKGAYSYFSKGENLEEELPYLIKQALKMQKLERENKVLRSRLKESIHFDNIVAVSKQMQQILGLIENIKLSNEPVLITGESGVGKEVIADHIYEQGDRFSHL